MQRWHPIWQGNIGKNRARRRYSTQKQEPCLDGTDTSRARNRKTALGVRTVFKTSERLSFRAVTLHIERFPAQGTAPSLSRLLDPFGSLLMLTHIILELFLLCQTALQRAGGCPEVNQPNPSNGLSGLPNSAGGILVFGLVAAKSKIDSDTVT